LWFLPHVLDGTYPNGDLSCPTDSNLGPSALAGFSVFFFLTPIQGKIMKSLFLIRRKTMVWTDKRAKLLQELLGGMKLIKFFRMGKSFSEPNCWIQET
jgi:hypothetical protein